MIREVDRSLDKKQSSLEIFGLSSKAKVGSGIVSEIRWEKSCMARKASETGLRKSQRSEYSLNRQISFPWKERILLFLFHTGYYFMESRVIRTTKHTMIMIISPCLFLESFENLFDWGTNSVGDVIENRSESSKKNIKTKEWVIYS